ncbi:hypothetical protein E2C01_059712 [Portunus trituberculatus]|uniref:Endonuclease/exonuclease/phosphatase domain-containing protein n=1 Tax=Portunus trituberculatus TaxID=210409 RepID=A0A5B7H9T7_PORTR|nr:hypothetical protein [Portunus trituberculatus]
MKQELTRKDRVMIVGDFNCEEIMWKDYEVVNGGEWAEELLNVATNNLMTRTINFKFIGVVLIDVLLERRGKGHVTRHVLQGGVVVRHEKGHIAGDAML